MKGYRFMEFVKEAKEERGFTHIEGEGGIVIPLDDFITKKRKAPRAPRGCFWAGNGASLTPNITLYSKFGENLGFYKLVRC